MHSLEAFHYIIFHTSNFFGSYPNNYRAGAKSQCYRPLGKKINKKKIRSSEVKGSYQTQKKKKHQSLQLVEEKNIFKAKLPFSKVTSSN